MKRLFFSVLILTIGLSSACGPDEDDPNNPNPSQPNTPGDTKLPERDGIPSDTANDRLLYFASSQQDGPGLYAYQPGKPDQAPVYIDPDFDLMPATTFTMPLMVGSLHPNGDLVDYRNAGFFYAIRSEREIVAGTMMPAQQIWRVSTDPAQLQQRQRVSSYESIPGMLAIGDRVVTYDLTTTDMATFTFPSIESDNNGNAQFQGWMTETDDPLTLPGGKVIDTFLGDDMHTHAHWLMVDKNGDLVFYNDTFDEKVPVLDDATGNPITGMARTSNKIAQLDGTTSLVALVAKSDQNQNGEIGALGATYRIDRPSAAEPNGIAHRITDDQGEPLTFSVGIFGSLSLPDGPLLVNIKGALYFGGGDSLFGMFDDPTNAGRTKGISLTRVDGDHWTRLSLGKKDDGNDTPDYLSDLGMLPNVFLAIGDGKIFWAPNGKPEVIDVTSTSANDWTRTSLSDTLPTVESTKIFSENNGWIYYQSGSSGDNAAAYNVNTQELIKISGGQWIGGSSNGKGQTGRRSRVGLSEVFLLTRDKKLLALEAAHPDKGTVFLGQLDRTTDSVTLNGNDQGPHRLLQYVHNDSTEVIYVDTTRKNSLKMLMDAPVTDWTEETTMVDMPQEATQPLIVQ